MQRVDLAWLARDQNALIRAHRQATSNGVLGARRPDCHDGNVNVAILLLDLHRGFKSVLIVFVDHPRNVGRKLA